MGLVGPAMVHVRHQQEAERLGVSQVGAVKENLTLLKEYLEANSHDGDLREWMDAWNTAEEQGAATKSTLQDTLPAIAQILVGYVAEAQAWKRRRTAPEQAH